LVAIPIGYDQPGVAARIAYHRVGEFIEVQDLSAEGLSVLIRKVLHDPSYRDRARFFREAIAAANGLEVACDLIERAFGIRARTMKNRPARAVGVRA
jgi:zeaxanthin glucosyltransferase